VSELQIFMRLPELSDLPPAPPHEPRYALRAAVRTYLRLGFVPELRTPDDARRWSKVLRNLARTADGAAKVAGPAASASS
jgi:hypothetical protein